MRFNIVTDLSNSFNPVPKPKDKRPDQKQIKSVQKRTKDKRQKTQTNKTNRDFQKNKRNSLEKR